jgi:hypothetical protein
MQPCEKLHCFVAEFFLKNLFDFVYAINVKKKSCFSVPDGMPMISAMFHEKDDMRLKLVP